MLKKQQLKEDIETAKRKAPRVLWAIYHIITIGFLIYITIFTILEINVMLTATPEMIQQSELAGQYGRLYNIEGYIALGVIIIIGTMFLRLIIRTIRKRYFG